MTLPRRDFLRLAAGAAALPAAAPHVARADTYPSRPVHLFIGYAPGGSAVLPGSPDDFGKLICDETDKWGKVIQFAGIKPE